MGGETCSETRLMIREEIWTEKQCISFWMGWVQVPGRHRKHVLVASSKNLGLTERAGLAQTVHH